MKNYIYNYDRTAFVNSAGGVIAVIPSLVYGEQAKWALALKTANGGNYDLSGITRYTAAVGTATVTVAATSSGIIGETATGTVNVPIDCFTDEFLSVVSGQANGVYAFFELSGFDAGGDKVLYLRFAVELREEINSSGLSPSMEDKILDTVASGGYTTSAAATDIAREVMSSGGGMPSGAIIENQPISTTVGGYTMSFDGNDGLEISNPDAAVNVRINGGGVYLDVIGGSAYIDDISMRFKTYAGNEIAATESGVTANGSAITQVSSAFAGTSLGIEEIAGGVKYVCQSALTALSIGSAAPGCNATIFFTVANGAIVTPPANVRRFGVTSYTPGSSYAMVVNGDMVIVVEEDTGV